MNGPELGPALTARVTALIESGRIPHAVVLDGGSASARLALADFLGQALLCTAPEGRPCGNCAPCRKVLSGSHPDLIHITPEPGRKTLTVDVIRRMREDAYILPNESDHKVYVVEQAELLQDYAQNALLKILEEPPAYATFLLCTASKSALLPTVLSRTAVFSLNADPSEETDETVREESLARAKTLAEAVLSKKELELLAAVSTFEKNYDALPATLDEFQLILRDALVAQAGGTHSLSPAAEEADRLSKRLPADRLLTMEQAVGEIRAAVLRHANKNLTLNRLCSRLAAAAWG